MSVDNANIKQSFTMDGITTAFTLTLNVLYAEPTSIKAAIINATNTKSTLTYTTDYTVSPNVNGVGGIIYVTNAQSATDKLWVYRETSDLQSSDYEDYNQFPADTVEKDFDRRTMRSQESKDAIDRALKFSVTTTNLTNSTLPTPVNGMTLVWSGTDGTLINSTVNIESSSTLAISAATVAQGAATSASVFAANALASQYAASTLATLAASSATVAASEAVLAASSATFAAQAAKTLGSITITTDATIQMGIITAATIGTLTITTAATANMMDMAAATAGMLLVRTSATIENLTAATVNITTKATIASLNSGLVTAGNITITTSATIAAATITTLEIGRLVTPYAQTLTVAKSGGDYTTITAALAAITDAATGKRYCIKVMPGTYVENVTGKDYVDIIAAGSWNDTIITASGAGVALNYSDVNDSTFRGFKVINTASIDNHTMVTSSNTNVVFQDCWVEQAYNNGGDYALFNAGNNTDVRYIDCVFKGFSTSTNAIRWGDTSADSRVYFENVEIFNCANGFTYYANGATSTASVINFKNCHITAATKSIVMENYNDNTYGVINSEHNVYKTGTINLDSQAATRSVVFNSNFDEIPSVTKDAGGGTETFNAYGSVVGGVLQNNLNGTAGHSTVSGDTYLKGKLEVDGATWLDSWTYQISLNTGTVYTPDGTNFYGTISSYTDDGWHLSVGTGDNQGNRNLIIASGDYWNSDYDHDTLSANPTLFIHSATDPDSDNTQWLSLTHDQTNGVINAGKGNVQITKLLATAGNLTVTTNATMNMLTASTLTVTTSATIASLVVTGVVQDTNFKKISILGGGPSIYISDGTVANGALNGTAGDICLKGGSNGIKLAYCTTTGTTWADA